MRLHIIFDLEVHNMYHNDECDSFRDVANNIRYVRHSTVFTEEERAELEEKIAEDLYRIFTHDKN